MEGNNNPGAGVSRTRARATGRGRGNRGARSLISGFDANGGGGSSSSTPGYSGGIDGAVIGGDSLAARALASATKPVGLAEQEECGGGGWHGDSGSVDEACIVERGAPSATGTDENEFGFTADTAGK